MFRILEDSTFTVGFYALGIALAVAFGKGMIWLTQKGKRRHGAYFVIGTVSGHRRYRPMACVVNKANAAGLTGPPETFQS